MGGDPDLFYSLKGVKAACDSVRGRIPDDREFSEQVWTEFFLKVGNNPDWSGVQKKKDDHLQFFVNYMAFGGRAVHTVKACEGCSAKIDSDYYIKPGKDWVEPPDKPFAHIGTSKQQNGYIVDMFPAVCVQGKCRYFEVGKLYFVLVAGSSLHQALLLGQLHISFTTMA